MAELYRKSALEKLSSPEQLDKALTVTSPMSWLALIAVTVMIIVTIIWSIVGTIPVTVTTKGIVAAPVSTNAVFAKESGKVDAVLVSPGALITVNTPILQYRTGNGDVGTLLSDQTGTVTDIRIKEGDEIRAGSPVIRFSPYLPTNGNQVVVCYVKYSDSNKIKPAMEANVFLSAFDSQTYGHMRARVVCIDSYASDESEIAFVTGQAGNRVASSFQDNGAVVAVTCELLPDSAENRTVSGFWWSNAKGAKCPVDNFAEVNAKIITEEVRPITKLFSKLKDLWGD